MATVVNFIDTTLRGADARNLADPSHTFLLACDTPGGFKVAADGTATPSSITFSIVRLGLTAEASFTVSGSSTLDVNGDTATLTYAHAASGTVTVTATITEDGAQTTRTLSVSKVYDGAAGSGTPGARGAGQYYAQGNSWSDLIADMATPGDTMVDDQVVIWNGTSYAEARRWNGTAWVSAGATLPGDLIVPGSIIGNRLKAGTVELFMPDGTPIIKLGSGLQSGFEAPGTKNSEQKWVDVSGTGKPADNASADITLIGRNGAVVTGNAIKKSSGTAGWNADAYSVNGYTGGAYASGSAADTAHSVMLGLNGDPTADSSYSSIDYAFYLTGAGTVEIYEGGNARGQFSTYVAGDVFLVAYDGANVTYSKNGTALRTLAVGSITYPLYFDSSLNDIGGQINNARFGPMSDISAGVNANNAIPGINTSIAAKLSKAGADTISGQISLQSTYALLVGTANDGIFYGSTGMYGRKGGYTTFSIAADGTATFAGSLIAASGTFGAVSIAAGGSLALQATGYNTDTGLWFGFAGGQPKFSIKTANGSSFLCDPANNVLSMNGVQLLGFTVPSLGLAFTDNLATSKPNTTASVAMGSATANVSNVTGAVSYSWSIDYAITDPDGSVPIMSLSGENTATVSLSGRAPTNTAIIYSLKCVVVDSNNMTKTLSIKKRCQFGTAV